VRGLPANIFLILQDNVESHGRKKRKVGGDETMGWSFKNHYRLVWLPQCKFAGLVFPTLLKVLQDPELNFPDGDVLVFLHEPGSSRRGASFRLHAELIATTGFQSLVDRCVVAPIPTHWAMPPRPDGQTATTVNELYLPAPQDADKETISRHHLATRNLFAWLYDRPMTGKTLGAALVDVLSRAHLYRPNAPETNNRDMLAYLDRRGYIDFRECVDHALAALRLAETFGLEDLWVNAFAHCVGLNHSLHMSIEFDVSLDTSLIDRLLTFSGH
jgi:hypothetical protein